MTSGDGWTGRVASCRRYPVKSLQGLEVGFLEVDPHGIDGDRAYGLIDVGTGKVLAAKRTAALLLASADDDAITLPDGSRVGLHERGPTADEALSAWVGRPVRLVAAPEAGAVSYEMTFDPPNEDAEVFDIPAPPGTLLDLTPVHFLASASLAACEAARPDLDWDVRRFRPNLVLDLAAEPWEEQTWVGRDLAVGTAVLRVTMPMVRCAMPLRAQPGGLAKQPALFKALSELNEAHPNHLGMCCDVIEPGRIAVGDAVTLAA